MDAQFLMMLWFWILPVIGIFSLILVPLFWFFVVPQLSRSLTWARFQNCILFFIGDNAGRLTLVKSRELIPEGIVHTKDGWEFLPSANPKGRKVDADIEKMALKVYTLSGHGKPVLLGYAGKVTVVNPATLASMQQNKDLVDPGQIIAEFKEDVEELPGKYRRYFKKSITKLESYVKARKVTVLDLSQIKKVLQGLYPPTLIDALATNRELRGMKRAGSQYTTLLLGGAIIIAILVFGVIAIFSMG